MNTISDRLRQAVLGDATEAAVVMHEAADEIERLREALQECAGDLESYVDELYPSRTSYPIEQQRYERDIESVRKARALLSN
jgi:sugar-specific transcriptional regulator TrmB